jgi:hypothetical protein
MHNDQSYAQGSFKWSYHNRSDVCIMINSSNVQE